MIIINKYTALVIFLILIIGISYTNNENSIKKIGIANEALLEEAKFYGVNVDLDTEDKNIDLQDNTYIEEARFWGVSQVF